MSERSRRDGSLPPETHSYQLPFDISSQLCEKLSYNKSQDALLRLQSKRDIEKDWLPGDPRIRLRDPHIVNLLCTEHATPRLDDFSQYLWLVGTPDSSHVASLTHQIVRGRRIILTDDPELHLVWIRDRVFVKPLPEYLLSYTFWEHLSHGLDGSQADATQRRKLYKALTGFIRTYSYLIRHKSDFELATHPDHRLIRKDILYSDLVQLLEAVENRIVDEDVSPRWQYGELRLSRLNFWSRVLLKHHNFVKVHGQYSDYVAQFYAPILFVFAILSVILNAMQVGQSISRPAVGEDYLQILDRMSKVFVPLSLLVVMVAVLWFLVAIVSGILRIVLLGLRTQAQKRMRYRSRAN